MHQAQSLRFSMQIPRAHTNIYPQTPSLPMANCVRCGRTLEEFDVGGDMVCDSCEATGHGAGGAQDVPCQRCGMYLPSHELQMWNSRLYCAYCIMDVKDEEKMAKAHSSPTQEREGMPQEGRMGSGTCERCGRQSEFLYSAGGRRLCQHCYSDGESEPSNPGGISQIAVFIKSIFGKKEPAKILSMQPLGLQPEKRNANPQKASSPPATQEKQQHFDIQSRSLVEKETGMGAQIPIAERAKEDKKPSPKVKKDFFRLHPASPKKK